MQKLVILFIFLGASIQREFKDLKSFNRYFDPSRRVNYLTYLHVLEGELKNRVFEVYGRNRVGRSSSEYKFITGKYIQEFIDKVENKSIFQKIDISIQQYRLLRDFFDWISALLEDCKTYSELKSVCDKWQSDYFYDIDSKIAGILVRTSKGEFVSQMPKRRIVFVEAVNCAECMNNGYASLLSSGL